MPEETKDEQQTETKTTESAKMYNTSIDTAAVTYLNVST